MSTWRPIIAGTLRASARECILSVARELCQPASAYASLPRLCDLALLCAYMARSFDHREWTTRAVDAMDQAIELASRPQRYETALHTGVTGLGWTIEHVGMLLGDGRRDNTSVDSSVDSTMDSLEDIDRYLAAQLRSPWQGPYELVGGLVGIGVYFLERLPKPVAHDALDRIVGHLEARATSSLDGVSWQTSPEHVQNGGDGSVPTHYNLGVAHGVPGVIQFLGEVAAHRIQAPRARALAEGAVAWLLAHQLPPDAASRFSPAFVPGEKGRDSQLAWCYGDLGIAAVLRQAGRRFERPDWIAFANGLALHCAHRSAERVVVDVALCHGAFGVAHLFNRFWQAEQDDGYRRAAIEWYRHGLSMIRPGTGIGGVRAVVRNREEPTDVDASFLWGAPGAALALLAATESIEPGWDRLLLLS